MSVIANTTVVSNFASIGQLDILRQLFGALALSLEVYDEIKAGRDEGYRFYKGIEQWIAPLVGDAWIQLTSLTHEQAFRYVHGLPSRLHRGEAASLAIAKHRGWLLLTDDREARQEAKREGIMVSGSIGCLVLAVERYLCDIEQANGWLAEMIQQGYRSPVTDLAPLIQGS